MAGIGRFEEIEAWKAGRVLSREIYLITAGEPFSADWGLRSQMRGAVVSIMSNTAEGFERGGNNEFIQFLALAKGSCGELRSQLYVALDNNYITQKEFERLSSMAMDISRILAGLMSYLRQSSFRGPKYKQKNPRPPNPPASPTQ